MPKGRIFKIYCEYFIKAKTRQEVDNYVQNEIACGFDFYERHIIVDEIEISPIIDVDLTK